jgi:hypothetical protein
MKNPNRTTKPERRAARRRNPMMCAALGTGATVRLRRAGAFDTDRDALGKLADLFHTVADPPPLDLAEATMQLLDNYRLQMAVALDVPPGYLSPSEAPETAVTTRTLDHFAEAFTEQALRPELERIGLDPNRYAYTFEHGDLDPWDSAEVIAPTGAIPADLDHLRGACTEPELHNALAALLAEDIPAGDEQTWAVDSTWACIVCGDKTEPSSTVCSAGCGHQLTGEYPPLYEKDYGDE